MKQKLIALQQTLNQHVIGRESVIKSALLSLVAGENILLIGPPGTAKSMIARSISQVVQAEQGNHYFEYLLTKFSTPEEIFGPLSISELKQDRFKRNTDGYLPTVQVAFLDEIFKASSSILNALLTILNERKYHNGTHTIDTPLISIISASNELPTGQAELSALYDRFLIRSYVDYLPSQGLSELFEFKKSTPTAQKLTTAELQTIQHQAENVIFPDDVQQTILQIWQKVKDEFKDNADESLSDRRFVKCLHLMRISAVTNDRTEVDFSDVFLLKDCLWNTPESAEKIVNILKEVLKNYNNCVYSDKEIDENEGVLRGLHNKIINLDSDIDYENLKEYGFDDDLIDILKTNDYREGVFYKRIDALQDILGACNSFVGESFDGRGIAKDPFLIKTIDDLRALERLEMDSDYYFKQVNDIDCTSIQEKKWFKIAFKGKYDGNGKKIIYKNSKKSLFNMIDNGYVKNLSLKGLSLSKRIYNSEIFNCHGDSMLFVGDSRTNEYAVENSKIRFCSADKCLAKNVENSAIQYCTTKSTLISDEVHDTHISDCLVVFDDKYYPDRKQVFGIAREVLDNSIIERCFIGADVWHMLVEDFTGICDELYDSKVLNCVVGKVRQSDGLPNLRNVISNYISEIEIYHNKNHCYNEFQNDYEYSESECQEITYSDFNKEYFENELNWDFKYVWQWNDDEYRPELRQRDEYGYSIHYNEKNYNYSEPLLKIQLNHNIWL